MPTENFIFIISASTSENWNTFLEPIMLDKEPYCNPNAENSNPIKGKGDCGNRTIGIMYFISFVIITFLIVVNMYIGKYKNVQNLKITFVWLCYLFSGYS